LPVCLSSGVGGAGDAPDEPEDQQTGNADTGASVQHHGFAANQGSDECNSNKYQKRPMEQAQRQIPNEDAVCYVRSAGAVHRKG